MRKKLGKNANNCFWEHSTKKLSESVEREKFKIVFCNFVKLVPLKTNITDLIPEVSFFSDGFERTSRSFILSPTSYQNFRLFG